MTNSNDIKSINFSNLSYPEFIELLNDSISDKETLEILNSFLDGFVFSYLFLKTYNERILRNNNNLRTTVYTLSKLRSLPSISD